MTENTTQGRREADRVRIFDTTLRDGEQSPGISLNKAEKLEIANQLARLGVDIIEAGFPITSPGDFEAVQAIAREVHGPVICGLSRTSFQDIDAAWKAIKDSERPRIHTFIATSDIHIERKLQTTRDDVKGQARAAVAHAKHYTDDVEFSPEDGSRSDVEFMAEVIQIARTSRLVSRLTGYNVQPNKAIVGRNAFAHEAGIHQDGVLKERTTYEIMDATTIGLETNSIVLGKHSGRHALRKALEELGFEVEGPALNTAFRRFKDLADKKKAITALDLEAIVSDEMRQSPESFVLKSFDIEASSNRAPLAHVAVRMPGGEVAEGNFTGDGPVDAFFSAINAATGHEARLKEYHVSAVTGGRDALGEVTVLLELNGFLASGQGVSTDILEASGRAYLRALSNALSESAAAEAEHHLRHAGAVETPTP